MQPPKVLLGLAVLELGEKVVLVLVLGEKVGNAFQDGKKLK